MWDLLVLLTDGVTEAIGADESPFGLQHALDWIIRNREKKSRRNCRRLNQVARNFYTDALASDDITSLVCKVE
jgi:serine phosphatase RsbU (regulator of sigma subunit)